MRHTTTPLAWALAVMTIAIILITSHPIPGMFFFMFGMWMVCEATYPNRKV